MQIWVDADACPGAIKDILFRAADRVQVRVTLVANRNLATPRSPWVRCLRVAHGFDVADREIVDQVAEGDLVVTADIPLAADVVSRGATALNPRGELYTEDNVREALAVRDLMDELRSAGMPTSGPAAFSQADRRRFADQLDRWLARSSRSDTSAGQD